jgi:hypothetical protein
VYRNIFLQANEHLMDYSLTLYAKDYTVFNSCFIIGCSANVLSFIFHLDFLYNQHSIIVGSDGTFWQACTSASPIIRWYRATNTSAYIRSGDTLLHIILFTYLFIYALWHSTTLTMVVIMQRNINGKWLI